MNTLKNYVTTEETKKITGLDDSGIRKLRKIYRDKGQIGSRELFTVEQVEDLKKIVKYQRENPHVSYQVAYDIVWAEIKKNLFGEAADDMVKLASLAMGEKKLDRFFDLFNALTDLIKPYDEDSAELLKNAQSPILAKIGITALNRI